MKIHHLATVALGGALVLALAGCTGGGAPAPQGGDGAADGEITGKISFQTWSLKNDKFTPYFEDLISAFEKEHPGTEIDWIDQPGEGYEDKVLQQAEAGELPDVVNLPPEFAYSLADAGQLMDLAKASDKIDDYVPGGIEAYRYDEVDGPEGSFGFPWYLGTELNYWNTELLASAGISEAPADFDAFLDAAEKLGKAGVPSLSGLPGVANILSFVADGEQPAPMYDGKGFVFNTPEAAAMIDRYAELYKAGAVAPSALQGSEGGNVNQFNTGAVAWTTAGPNYIEKDIAVNAPSLMDKVAVTGGYAIPPLFVQGISVSQNTKNAATAVAFAEFVTNNENQVAFVKIAQGFFPGTAEANADPSTFVPTSEIELQNTATTIAGEQMSKAQALQPPVWSADMNTYANQQIALAVTGEISGQEALDAAVEYANGQL